MASRPYATTARSMSAMHVKVSATVAVALCSGFRHLKRMSQTVLPARIHIVNCGTSGIIKNGIKIIK